MRLLVSLLTISTLCLAPLVARADLFELNNGGRVEGEVTGRGDAGSYLVRTPNGVELTIPRLEISRLVVETPAMVKYQQLERVMPDTAAAHRKLAAWCSQQELTNQAEHHLQRLLQLDPNDEAARHSLGYQRIGTRWFTREQIMQGRGMKKYKGKYRTPQDIALRQAEEHRKETVATWYGTLKTWRGWLTHRRRNRVDEAYAELNKIDDPLATPALVKWLDDEPDPSTRQTLLEILATLNHTEAIRTLVQLSWQSEDREERLLCLDLLTRHNKTVSLVPYIKQLGEKDNVVVNRAAVALAHLSNPEAISALIDHLQTQHKFVYTQGPPGDINASFSPAGGGGGLSMGGKGPVIERKMLKNLEVKRALSKLSDGEDFGYDQVAWRRWYVNQQKYNYVSSRRDQ